MSRRTPPQLGALSVIATLAILGLLRLELNAVTAQPLLDPALDSTGWTISANSEESAAQDGSVANLLDGIEDTIWHTKWSGSSDGIPDDYPHIVTIDFSGKLNAVSGLRYMPRKEGHGDGSIGTFQVCHRQTIDWGKGDYVGRNAPQAIRKSIVGSRYKS